MFDFNGKQIKEGSFHAETILEKIEQSKEVRYIPELNKSDQKQISYSYKYYVGEKKGKRQTECYVSNDEPTGSKKKKPVLRLASFNPKGKFLPNFGAPDLDIQFKEAGI